LIRGWSILMTNSTKLTRKKLWWRVYKNKTIYKLKPLSGWVKLLTNLQLSVANRAVVRFRGTDSAYFFSRNNYCMDWNPKGIDFNQTDSVQTSLSSTYQVGNTFLSIYQLLTTLHLIITNVASQNVCIFVYKQS